jgi:hypothetical protein
MATQQSVSAVVIQGLGGRLFLALWGGLTLVLGCRAIGLSAWLTTGAVIALIGACSLGQRPLASVAVAITGWLVVDGFVEHRSGQLGFDSRTVWVLIASVALALTISSITRKAAP